MRENKDQKYSEYGHFLGSSYLRSFQSLKEITFKFCKGYGSKDKGSWE